MTAFGLSNVPMADKADFNAGGGLAQGADESLIYGIYSWMSFFLFQTELMNMTT